MTAVDGDVSPLAEIERAVQEQAKALALDMAAGDGPARLHDLLEHEVARWNLDFKRGTRSFDLADPGLVVERAHRNLVGYGPLGPLLADDDVWEIMVNAPDAIFVRRHRGPSGYHDEVFHDDDQALREDQHHSGLVVKDSAGPVPSLLQASCRFADELT